MWTAVVPVMPASAVLKASKSNWRAGLEPAVLPIDYAPFIHNLFDSSLINICPRRAYLLANSDSGVTPLSAASAGDFHDQ
jgi:hypothetical protein